MHFWQLLRIRMLHVKSNGVRTGRCSYSLRAHEGGISVASIAGVSLAGNEFIAQKDQV